MSSLRSNKREAFPRGRLLLIVIAVFAALFCASSSHAASFTVDSWRFQTGVAGPDAGETDSDIWTSIVNPLNLHQQAVWGDSFSTADLMASWTSISGIFGIDVSQKAARVPNGSLTFTVIDGTVRITPSVDLILVVSASYSYQLPSAEMRSRMLFDLREGTNLSNLIFIDDHIKNAFPGEPASGTFNLNNQILLPAGHQWRIHYLFELDAFSGPLGPFATGNGGLDFTLSPANVPEPAAFAPLALLALLIHHRAKPNA